MVRVAAARRVFETVRAVRFSPSSTGRPEAIMVDRVRAMRAACRSRINRPMTGRRSRAVSALSLRAGRRRARPASAPAQTSTRAATQPQSRMAWEMPMMIRVSRGSCWFMLVNWSTTFGTTKVMRAVMTASATTARAAG